MMWLANFQTLLLLLQVAVCEADDASALSTGPPIWTTSAASAASATVAPANVKRRLGAEVIGSTTVAAYVTTWSCPAGSTWTTLSNYAGCRTTASVQAPMYTGCSNTSVRIGPFDHDTCSGSGAQLSCVTGWIYYNDNKTLTNYGCWPTWTQGNWEAWREEPEGLAVSTIVAIAVVVPVVVIGAVVAGLWWWRRRRRRQEIGKAVLEGLSKSATGTTTPTTQTPDRKSWARSMYGSRSRRTTELDEQRRPSELSTGIAPHDNIFETIDRVEEERDDGSSYHTTESRQARHELYAQQVAAQQVDGTDQGTGERGAMQRMLQHFHLQK